MKLGERLFEQDGKMIHHRVFDPTQQIEDASAIRSLNGGEHGENKHVARVPLWMVTEWLKEAGVKWDDPAAENVIKRNLMSGNYSKLRVWGGTY